MEDNPNRYTINVNKFTKGQQTTCNIEWKIPKLAQLLKYITTSYGFRAPRQTIVEVPNTPFKLKISFFGSESGKMILMELYYLTSVSTSIRSSVHVKFGDYINETLKDLMIIQANEWQYCMGLKCPNDKSTNDTLQISLKLVLSHAIKDVCNNTIPRTQLSDDLENLLTDDSYSDVTMKSVEGVEFKVHKILLAVRSEVLKAHFEHNMRESITNVVETLFETEVLRDVLRYMYTDKVPQVDNAPDKLLAAADYYQLMGLKSLCEETLSKRLTVENAVDTLQLAELHSATTLRLYTLEYIRGRAALVSKTRGWANIQSVEIIKIIYDYNIVVGDINNVDILTVALNEMSI